MANNYNNNNVNRNRNRNMPNIGRNINNKNISIFDIENIKKANAELEKQMKYYERRAEAIRNEIKLTEKLKQVNQKALDKKKAKLNDYASKLDDINKDLLENDDILNQWPKKMKSMLANPNNKEAVVANLINQANSNRGPIPKSIREVFNYKINNAPAKEVSDTYTKVAQSVYTKYKRNGADFSDSEVLKTVNKEIQEKTLAKLGDITQKYSTATTIFDTATKLFKSVVSTWWTVAQKGLNNQSSAFENTFENISVRNDISREQYYKTQAKTNNVLSSMGLRNNIATSDVQNMWDKMATNGVNIDMSSEKARAEVTANAIDAVLTNKIVPYLDTSSQDMQILNSRLDNKFFKDIRGINLANNDIAGNNYATKDLLQTLVDQVQPMSDEALQNLAQGSTELSAYANYLMSEEGGNLTKSQVMSIISQLYKEQQYSDQIMSSGSVYEKMGLINNINSGVNIYDPSQYNNAVGGIANAGQYLMGMTPGYNSTMTGLQTNIIGNSYGLDWNDRNAYIKMNKAGVTAKTDFTAEQIQEYANKATQNYANDKNQTKTTLQDVTLENLMNELAVGKQGLGHWTDIIVDAIKAIGTILTVKVVGGAIGKGIGALAGLGGSTMGASSGLGAVLGAAGPIALKVATVGALVAAGVAVGNAILEKANGRQTEAQNDYKNQYEAKGYDTNTASSLGKIQSITEFDKGSFLGQPITNISSDEKDQLGINRSFFLRTWKEIGDTKGKAWDNKQWYKYNNMAWLRTGFAFNVGKSGPDKKATLAAAIMYAIGLDQMGMLGSTKETNPLLNWGLSVSSKDDIGNLIRAGINEGLFSGWSAISGTKWTLSDDDCGPRDLEGKLYSGEISNKLLTQYGFNESNEADKYFMEHRYGLNEVPYDEYPALLHQGEAVLTANTANVLRDLLGEYQETSTQSVNFDTIIQTQTSALIAKMEDIINVITQNNTGSNFTTSTEQTKARSILEHSMLHLTSTKSF